MSPRIRSGHRRKTAPMRVGRRSAIRGRRKTLLPLQAAAFELWPDELQLLLSLEDVVPDDLEEPRDLTSEGENRLALDSELTGDDEEEPGQEVEEASRWDAGVICRAGESYTDAPKLEPARFYILAVAPTVGGNISCRFEPPAWFRRPTSPKLAQGIRRLEQFLRALGSWFEEHKQGFLDEPTATKFVENEDDFRGEAVVVQEGLLQRLNERLRFELRLDPSHFSRVLPKVWLLWPNWNLPVESLFSVDFRLAWVARGALWNLAPEGWQVRELGPLDDAENKAIRTKSFENLSQAERIHYLCRKARVPWRKGLKAVLEEVSRRSSILGGATSSPAGTMQFQDEGFGEAVDSGEDTE